MGIKHGDGVFTSSEGKTSYKGQFKDDKSDGEGTYAFANGRTYTGQWTQSHMNGQGVMVWPDGSKYVGEYTSDLRSGKGTMAWPDGSNYWHFLRRRGPEAGRQMEQRRLGERVSRSSCTELVAISLELHVDVECTRWQVFLRPNCRVPCRPGHFFHNAWTKRFMSVETYITQACTSRFFC